MDMVTVTRCDGQPVTTYATPHEAWSAIHTEYPDAGIWAEGDGAVESPDELYTALRRYRVLVWPTCDEMDGPDGLGDDGSSAYAEITADED